MGGVVWDLKVRGGAYDGWEAETTLAPQEVLILWRCEKGCPGHGTFNPEHPGLNLRTAESYKRVEFDTDAHLAVYEQADGTGGDGTETEERELVGAGAGWDDGASPYDPRSA